MRIDDDCATLPDLADSLRAAERRIDISNHFAHSYTALAQEIIRQAQKQVKEWLRNHDRLRETLARQQYLKSQLDVAGTWAWLNGAESLRLTATFIYDGCGADQDDVTETLEAQYRLIDRDELDRLTDLAFRCFRFPRD